ncbi:NUDIX hydrolase [Streptomyces sp. NPDC059104]|uniref:NUDIX hydrolase n=1 Tax=Streptomyces sp. NPDC059104 TaxID=3346729 RepID=UPI0036939BF3
MTNKTDGPVDDGRYRLGATCVVFDGDGNVLIQLRRSPVRWELPGGLVEPGEHLHDAAAREAEEETGVSVRVRHLVGVYQHPSKSILAAVFVAVATGGVPRPSAEASEVRWVGVGTARELLHPLYRPRLEDALNRTAGVPLWIHEGQHVIGSLPARTEGT